MPAHIPDRDRTSPGRAPHRTHKDPRAETVYYYFAHRTFERGAAASRGKRKLAQMHAQMKAAVVQGTRVLNRTVQCRVTSRL